MAEVGVGLSITLLRGELATIELLVHATITAGTAEVYREGLHGTAVGDLEIESGLTINRIRIVSGQVIINRRGAVQFATWASADGRGAGKSFYLVIGGDIYELPVADATAGAGFILWNRPAIPVPSAGDTVMLIVADQGVDV